MYLFELFWEIGSIHKRFIPFGHVHCLCMLRVLFSHPLIRILLMIQGFSSLGISFGVGAGCLLSLGAVLVWQVKKRYVAGNAQQQKLLEDLQLANTRSEQLNAVLAREIEQRRLAATVFEAASEGIVILDPAYTLLAVNQAFSRISGYSVEELVGYRVAELACGRDAFRHSPIIQQSLDQQDSWQGELVEARKSGELYPQW